MPKGRTFTGQEVTQKVLDMSTDSNMERESEVYSDTVLCRDHPKHVYGRKHGHTDSSVVDKDKLSDDSFEFQDDELQMSPQCTLQNLRSLCKHMRSGSPLPSTSMPKPPMRRTSMPMGLGEDMVSSLNVVSHRRYICDAHTLMPHKQSWRRFWVWYPAVCGAQTPPTHQYAHGFHSCGKYTDICNAQTLTPSQHAHLFLFWLAQTPTMSQHTR